jgi:hypothetical protein
MARRRKISARVICKLGTLAHNRAFTPSDLSSYAGAATGTVQSLVRRGIVTRVSSGRYYPTWKGWKVIDRACTMAHGRSR